MTWTVFFFNDCKWWLGRKFLKAGFRHVAAVSYLGDGAWLFVDPVRRHLLIDVLRGQEAIEVMAAWRLSADYRLTVRVGDELSRPPRVCSCVGAIKWLLGVRSGALVPHQLYRDLLARGAIQAPAEVQHGLAQA